MRKVRLTNRSSRRYKELETKLEIWSPSIRHLERMLIKKRRFAKTSNLRNAAKRDNSRMQVQCNHQTKILNWSRASYNEK